MTVSIQIPAKKVSESVVHAHTYKVFPNDLNSYGTVFGGMIMATLDRITLVVAERHSGQTCVTVSVDAMHFLAPAGEGDILLFYASVNCSWRTSMEIGAKVLAEHYQTGEKRHILSAYFTFVAMDANHQPALVPQVIPESAIEQRRLREAGERRLRRHRNAEARRAARDLPENNQ